MALVTFVDDSAPYLNAQNLNNNFNEINNKTIVENVTYPTVNYVTKNNQSAFKRVGNIYQFSLIGTISSNDFTTNTEKKIISYNFGVPKSGVITYIGDSSIIGTFVANANGLYVNFSRIWDNETFILNFTYIV